jgi:hypothetical protein
MVLLDEPSPMEFCDKRVTKTMRALPTRQRPNRLHAGILLIRWQEHRQRLLDRRECACQFRWPHGLGVDANTRTSSFDCAACKHFGKSAGGDDLVVERYRRAHVRMAKPRIGDVIPIERDAVPDVGSLLSRRPSCGVRPMHYKTGQIQLLASVTSPNRLSEPSHHRKNPTVVLGGGLAALHPFDVTTNMQRTCDFPCFRANVERNAC